MECPITKEIIVTARHLVCGHAFEERAINEWLQSHTTCPVCRHDINIERISIEENESDQGIEFTITGGGLLMGERETAEDRNFLHSVGFPEGSIASIILLVRNGIDYHQIPSNRFYNIFNGIHEGIVSPYYNPHPSSN